MNEKKVREVLNIVKNYNREKEHYEAPYLDSENMRIIEEALEKQLPKKGIKEKLKKCPFCGGEAKIKMKRKNDDGWSIWCECEKCHAKAEEDYPSMQNEDSVLNSINICEMNAISAWNRRKE